MPQRGIWRDGNADGTIDRILGRRDARQCANGPHPPSGLGADHRRVFFRRHRLHHSRLTGAGHGSHAFCDAGRHRDGWQRHLARIVSRLRRARRVHRPARPQGCLPVRHFPLQRRDDRGGFGADRRLASVRPFHYRAGARRRTAALFLLCSGIFPQADPRTGDRFHAVHRRRLRLAARNPAGAELARHDRLEGCGL